MTSIFHLVQTFSATHTCNLVSTSYALPVTLQAIALLHDIGPVNILAINCCQDHWWRFDYEHKAPISICNASHSQYIRVNVDEGWILMLRRGWLHPSQSSAIFNKLPWSNPFLNSWWAQVGPGWCPHVLSWTLECLLYFHFCVYTCRPIFTAIGSTNNSSSHYYLPQSKNPHIQM